MRDLRSFLSEWPYDPENDARIIKGDDERDILQVRTMLGIEQYELEGRPDGARPHGLETALEYYLDKLAHARARGEEGKFKLSARQCGELFSEGTLYYFRYIRLFQLKDWGRTIRDTERNLRAFDFVHRFAQREEDRFFLEKWRPYILRVHATAQAMLLLEQDKHDAAIRHIEKAVSLVESLEDIEDETFRFERERSLSGLRDLLRQLQKTRPVSEIERLQEQLRHAIEAQDFERAAVLRDRLRALTKGGETP
jgi:hypothetical protein